MRERERGLYMLNNNVGLFPSEMTFPSDRGWGLVAYSFLKPHFNMGRVMHVIPCIILMETFCKFLQLAFQLLHIELSVCFMNLFITFSFEEGLLLVFWIGLMVHHTFFLDFMCLMICIYHKGEKFIIKEQLALLKKKHIVKLQWLTQEVKIKAIIGRLGGGTLGVTCCNYSIKEHIE